MADQIASCMTAITGVPVVVVALGTLAMLVKFLCPSCGQPHEHLHQARVCQGSHPNSVERN